MYSRIAMYILALVMLAACGGGADALVTGDKVNLRAEPSTASAVVTVLNANDKVQILDKKVADLNSEDVKGKLATLNKKANLDVEKKPYPMDAGSKLTIVRIGQSGKFYEVEFAAPKDATKKIKGFVAVADVDIEKTAIWYRIKSSSGQEGWVIERYISKN